MIYTFFDSSYGYNTNVRLGKIYSLTERDTIRYLLEVHPDLIDKSIWIKIFIKKVKSYYKKLILCKKIQPRHIHLVLLGILSWNQIFYVIENDIDVNNNIIYLRHHQYLAPRIF